jgi:hypothetical protein
MIAAEELGGIRQAALRNSEPNQCAADHYAFDTNGQGFAGEEIFFTAKFAQEIDISPSLVSKRPTLADADSREGFGCFAELLDEILGLYGSELLVEVHHQRVREAHSLHEAQLEWRRREEARNGAGAKNSRGMGIKRKRHGRSSDSLGLAQGITENRTMPEVHSIKNPGGDHHRALDFRQPVDGSEDSHHAPRKRETAGRLRTR